MEEMGWRKTRSALARTNTRGKYRGQLALAMGDIVGCVDVAVDTVVEVVAQAAAGVVAGVGNFKAPVVHRGNSAAGPR